MKPNIVVCLLIVAAVLAAPVPLHSAKQKEYKNTKYGYSLKYPSAWFITYLGKSEGDAVVVKFAESEVDAQFTDSAETGPVVEIIVSDLKELKGMGAKLPEIKTAADWIAWDRSNWDEEEKKRIGEYKDEPVSLSGLEGVRIVFKTPAFPGAGPAIEVILYNPLKELLYDIKYIGMKPAYDKGLKIFEDVLKSFTTF